MQTTLKELPNSRVEVQVEVPAADVEKATSRAARAMAKELRMPGFRAGKAPPSLVIQRVGYGTDLQEAIRDGLPEWYELALFDADVSPIGDPDIEMSKVPEDEGEPLEFKFAVGVRPPAKLGTYKGLEVGREEKEVPDEIVDTEVERVREGFARLEPVEREAADGDMVVIDFEGFLDGSPFQGGAAEEQSLVLGSGQFIPGFEEQLLGVKAGDERELSVTFPEDYQADPAPARIRSSRPGDRGPGVSQDPLRQEASEGCPVNRDRR